MTRYTGRKIRIRRVPTPPPLRRYPGQHEWSWRVSLPDEVFLPTDGFHLATFADALATADAWLAEKRRYRR